MVSKVCYEDALSFIKSALQSRTRKVSYVHGSFGGGKSHFMAVAGEEQATWFERHGSTPITEIPAEWPEWCRKVVARRIELKERVLATPRQARRAQGALGELPALRTRRRTAHDRLGRL